MIPTSVLVYIAAFSAGAQAVCSHNTHLWNPRAEADAAYGYTGLQGPLNWHSLNVNNTLCAKGTNQTPINLDNSKVKAGDSYNLTYPDIKKAEFVNLGTTVEVVADTFAAKLNFGGKDYSLKQFHFHTPSEHRIDEEFFPMEVHFVHVAAGMLDYLLASLRVSASSN
jgi:carbonic anhydrase